MAVRRSERLIPAAVRARLDEEPLALSPFVRLELQYLFEAKKVSVPSKTIVDYLVPKLEMNLTDPPAALVCHVATGARSDP